MHEVAVQELDDLPGGAGTRVAGRLDVPHFYFTGRVAADDNLIGNILLHLRRELVLIAAAEALDALIVGHNQLQT